MSKITTIEKAINQFSYRLKNGRYEPNQNDVDALTFVVEWINREKTKAINDNSLFAKLFVHVFAQEIAFYKGNFKMAQSKMKYYLEYPIEHYYENFEKSINDIELNNFRHSIGLTDQHPKLLTSEQSENEERIIKENEEELTRYFLGVWSSEKIYKSLNNTITEFINRYQSKP